MDYGIFNVRTDENAWDCAQGGGGRDIARESALKVDWESNPLLHWEWNLHQGRAGLMI